LTYLAQSKLRPAALSIEQPFGEPDSRRHVA
jgi:hypothetical protein